MRFSPAKKERLLSEYGLEGSKIRLLSASFNHTFCIRTADGRKFALRINTNSEHDEQGLRAEIEWVHALRRDTQLLVPMPIATKDGRYTTKFGKYSAVVYDWLEGKDVDDDPTDEVMAELAIAMTILHTHAERFKLSEQAKLSTCADTLWGAPYRLGDAERDVFFAVVNQSNADLAKLKTHKPIITHFDLHFSNLKFHEGKLAVFDFDDCQFAWPEMDIAITFFSLRGHVRHKEFEEVFLRHYGGKLRISGSELESLIAGRQALLVNWLPSNKNEDMSEVVRTYTPKAMSRLRRFLDTGVFSAIDP